MIRVNNIKTTAWQSSWYLRIENASCKPIIRAWSRQINTNQLTYSWTNLCQTGWCSFLALIQGRICHYTVWPRSLGIFDKLSYLYNKNKIKTSWTFSQFFQKTSLTYFVNISLLYKFFQMILWMIYFLSHLFRKYLRQKCILRLEFSNSRYIKK